MSLFFLWKYFERSGQLLLTWQECINRTKILTTSAGRRGRGRGRGCGQQTTQVVPSLNSPFLDCNNVTSHQHNTQSRHIPGQTQPADALPTLIKGGRCTGLGSSEWNFQGAP